MEFDKAKMQTAFRDFEFALKSAYRQFGVDGSAPKVLWARVDRAAGKLRKAAEFASPEIQAAVQRIVGP